MDPTLKTIQQPIAGELKEFEKRFRKSLKSDVALLDRIMYYITHRKGKQLRPIFTLLSARLFGDINDHTYRAASLVEIIHTASLVHDDVVDAADKRRGFFSINALWKNKAAVLVGDYLLSTGLILALENEEYQLLQILTGAVKSLSEGELLQMAKARTLDIEEDIYYDIIRQKTASMFSAAFEAGAATTTQRPEDLQRMAQLGNEIGMAFQIKDDLFDYGNSSIGKPVGIDIKEKKMTLPLIYALKQSNSSDKRRIITAIKRYSHKKNKVQEVIEFVKENGGLEYAEQKMQSYKQKALETLSAYSDLPNYGPIKDLIEFVCYRKK